MGSRKAWVRERREKAAADEKRETTSAVTLRAFFFEGTSVDFRKATKREGKRARDNHSLSLWFSFSSLSFSLSLSLSQVSCLRIYSGGGEKSVAWTMHFRRRCGVACGGGSGGGGSAQSRRMTKAVADVTVVIALIALALSSMPAANAQQPSPPPPPSSPSAVNPRHNRSVVVRDVGALRAALDDSGVSEILLADAGQDIDLDGAEAFPIDGPPAVVGAGRTLFIRSSDRNTPASLNFTGGPTPAIVVARDGALVFSQILLTSARPPSAAKARNPGRGIAESFSAPELGMWPSVSLEPGSEVRSFFVLGWGKEGVGERENRREERRREGPPAVLFSS